MKKLSEFEFNIKRIFNNDIKIDLTYNNLRVEMWYKYTTNILNIDKIVKVDEFPISSYPGILMEILEAFTGQTEDGQDLLYVEINPSYLLGTKFENYLLVPTPEDFLEKFIGTFLSSEKS